MLTSKTYSVGARVVCPVQTRVESRLVTLALHSLLGLMNVIVSISGCLQFGLHFPPGLNRLLDMGLGGFRKMGMAK